MPSRTLQPIRVARTRRRKERLALRRRNFRPSRHSASARSPLFVDPALRGLLSRTEQIALGFRHRCHLLEVPRHSQPGRSTAMARQKCRVSGCWSALADANARPSVSHANTRDHPYAANAASPNPTNDRTGGHALPSFRMLDGCQVRMTASTSAHLLTGVHQIGLRGGVVRLRSVLPGARIEPVAGLTGLLAALGIEPTTLLPDLNRVRTAKTHDEPSQDLSDPKTLPGKWSGAIEHDEEGGSP